MDHFRFATSAQENFLPVGTVPEPACRTDSTVAVGPFRWQTVAEQFTRLLYVLAPYRYTVDDKEGGGTYG